MFLKLLRDIRPNLLLLRIRGRLQMRRRKRGVLPQQRKVDTIIYVMRNITAIWLAMTPLKFSVTCLSTLSCSGFDHGGQRY